MDDLTLTAAELKDLRLRLDWTQQRLADELAIARNSVVRMENGQMAIELRTALAVRYLAWHYNKLEKVTRSPQPCTAPPAESAPDQSVSPDPRSLKRSDDSDLGVRMTRADDAWMVYLPALSDYKARAELKQRFFQCFHMDGRFYSYLFLLQLLEHLIKLPTSPDDYPDVWCNIRLLRTFARDLYNANPAWH